MKPLQIFLIGGLKDRQMWDEEDEDEEEEDTSHGQMSEM